MSKGTTKDSLERVPPYLPIVWQDWIGSSDIQSMTTAEEGIYLRLLLALWQFDEIICTPRTLARMIRVPDARTMRRWLEKFGHLLVMEKKHTVECAGNLREVYRNLTVDSRETSCECPVRIHNEKLKNLKNNVKNGMGLGSNQTKPKPNQTKPVSASQLVSLLTNSADAELEEEQKRPKELALLVLSDIETPVHDLPCYNALHEAFGAVTALPELTIREIHSVLKQLGEDESWMRGCLHFCFDHKKFWSQRIVTVQAFADALISGLDDPAANKLPAQYNKHLANKHRTAGAGSKR